MLDNPIRSVKVTQRHGERNSREEIVPNPFGGVNTHLWRNEAYIVGIVPYSTPFYTVARETRRPENPEAVRRCQLKEQNEEDVFSRQSNLVLALGL